MARGEGGRWAGGESLGKCRVTHMRVDLGIGTQKATQDKSC